jgi:hypothetical protein
MQLDQHRHGNDGGEQRHPHREPHVLEHLTAQRVDPSIFFGGETLHQLAHPIHGRGGAIGSSYVGLPIRAGLVGPGDSLFQALEGCGRHDFQQLDIGLAHTIDRDLPTKSIECLAPVARSAEEWFEISQLAGQQIAALGRLGSTDDGLKFGE